MLVPCFVGQASFSSTSKQRQPVAIETANFQEVCSASMFGTPIAHTFYFQRRLL